VLPFTIARVRAFAHPVVCAPCVSEVTTALAPRSPSNPHRGRNINVWRCCPKVGMRHLHCRDVGGRQTRQPSEGIFAYLIRCAPTPGSGSPDTDTAHTPQSHEVQLPTLLPAVPNADSLQPWLPINPTTGCRLQSAD